MKVGFISADWSDIIDPSTGIPSMGGSGHYRAFLPAQELRKAGVECVVVDRLGSRQSGVVAYTHDDVAHEDCDIIVFQRWMNKDAPQVFEAGRAAGQIIVNDVDDWYWGLDPKNRAFHTSSAKFSADDNRDHYWKSFAHSDYITTSTPYLASRLEKSGTPVKILRNPIDLDRWTPSEASESSQPVIGWVGSTTHRSGDLETLRGVIAPFCDAHDLTFRHAGRMSGSTHAGKLLNVDRKRWSTHEMVPIFDYPTLFEGIDIGIVPLADKPFNYSKSAIKGMEYTAAGVPFVAQRTPEYQWLYEEHGIGRTAKNAQQWKKHLTQLLDPAVRADDIARNRENIKALDITNTWHDWLDFYKSLT